MDRNESEYLETFLTPIRKSKEYRPKFGQGKKWTDSLYKSSRRYIELIHSTLGLGLDTDRMYSAQRAAGGMRPVYRQIGIGCERLFRAIVADSADYTAPEFATWSYSTKTPSGKTKTLSFDGRLMLSEIRNHTILENVQSWINIYCEGLAEVTYPENGVVFEVRQG